MTSFVANGVVWMLGGPLLVFLDEELRRPGGLRQQLAEHQQHALIEDLDKLHVAAQAFIDAQKRNSTSNSGRRSEESSGQDLAGSARITTGEAAGLLNIKPRAVQTALNSGRLEGEKVGGTWLTTVEHVETYRRRTART